MPPVSERIDTFRRLADRIGKERVIWRFDPLMLGTAVAFRRNLSIGDLSIDTLLERIAAIGRQLKGYTGKLVFSFIDIAAYRKVQRNLKGLGASEFPLEEQRRFARGLAELNKDLGLELATCGEEADLSAYGVRRDKCVDDELMMRLFRDDAALMNFIGAENDMFDGWHIPKSKKDKGQRKACGCIVSKDVGAYNTCPYLCRYCYANASPELALANWRLHRSRPLAPTITPGNEPPGIPLANRPST